MNGIIYKGEWSFPVRKDFILNPNISYGAKVLYIALKSYCAPNGASAFPSMVLLSKALNLNRDTVAKYANELESKGLLKRVQQHGVTGRFGHTLWTLYGSCSHEHL